MIEIINIHNSKCLINVNLITNIVEYENYTTIYFTDSCIRVNLTLEAITDILKNRKRVI